MTLEDSMVDSPEIRSPDGSGNELRASEARQAATGMGVRYVLVWGLALAVVAMVIIYLVMMR
jgi:hypothetical protein